MPRGDTCTCRGCCVFPNGTEGIIALIVSLCAYFMGVFANNGCFYVTVDLSDATGLDNSGLQNFGFGIWTREDPVNNYCVAYSEQEQSILIDSSWTAARAMASLGQICGFIAMVICICLSCVSIPQVVLKMTAFLSFAAGFFESLTFVYFSSDACAQFNCQFSRGAGVAVGAAVLYLLNTCIVLKVPKYQGRDEDDERFAPPPVVAQNDPPPGSVQVTVTELPNGTKKTTRTVVNEDGSRTVTETIEHPATPAAAAAPVASATVVPTGSAEQQSAKS